VRWPRRGIEANPPRLGRYEPEISRREILAGGVGVGALLALPELRPGGRSGARAVLSAKPASRFAFVYGTPAPGAAPSGSLAAATYPVTRTASLPGAVPVASGLAAAPVSSPDQALMALATVDTVPGGAKVTLTLLDATSAAVARQASLTVAGVPNDANILVTPVFAAGSAIMPVVLAITVPAARRLVSKRDAHTGGKTARWATTWRSHHALAYFNQDSGAFTGPFHLSDEPALALSTAVANGSDLLLWTTREPQPGDPAEIRAQAPLSRLSAFPLGSGTPRFSVQAPAPWPGGEPVLALPSGDVARLVRGRDVQLCAAETGEVNELSIAAFSRKRAKPSAVTMQARTDGTVFMAKPGDGIAVIADPARSFDVRAQVEFPAPASPLGAPWNKAVLSAEGETLYVLGPVATGGLSAYEVASGSLTAAYSEGRHYAGLYQLSSGALLAVRPQSPRLAFFSPSLTPLGTADTSIYVSAVF
jgi:hypothetical protein